MDLEKGVGLQYGLSAAAAALQAQRAVESDVVKQQEQFQCCLSHLQLQMQLHAADTAAPALSLNCEVEVMSAAQQGR